MIRFRHLALTALALAAAPWPAMGQKAQAAETQETLVWPSPPNEPRIKWVGEYHSEFDLGVKKRKSFLDRLAGKAEKTDFLSQPLSVAVDDGGLIIVGDFGLGIVGIDPVGHRMWTFSSVNKMRLAAPAGVAVDSKFVYACDSNSNGVNVFDKEGHFLRAIGAESGIKRPVGIAVDESRDLVVVVNGGDHIVLLLNRNLKLIKKVGNRGSKEGQFNFPTYCCIVPGKGFAVTDTGNFRVQVFDYNGKFLKSFGKAGDSSGSFSRPKGVAVDPDGNLYVVDSGFFNIQVFKLDGQVLTFIGNGGPGRGQFQVPCGIAIGKDGSIFVAEEANRRIQRFQYIPEVAGAAKGPTK